MKKNPMTFPTYKEVLEAMPLDKYPVGGLERLSILIDALKDLQVRRGEGELVDGKGAQEHKDQSNEGGDNKDPEAVA